MAAITEASLTPRDYLNCSTWRWAPPREDPLVLNTLLRSVLSDRRGTSQLVMFVTMPTCRRRLAEGYSITSAHNGVVSLTVQLTTEVGYNLIGISVIRLLAITICGLIKHPKIDASVNHPKTFSKLLCNYTHTHIHTATEFMCQASAAAAVCHISIWRAPYLRTVGGTSVRDH